MTLDFFAGPTCSVPDPHTPPDSHKLRPLLISRTLYQSSKASCLDGLLSPQAKLSGDAERALVETSIQAVAMVTVKARVMAAAMAAANVTATAATTAVAGAVATGSNSCAVRICVTDAAAGAMTTASTSRQWL